MADISKITLPNGAEYNLKDAQARSDIASIQTAMTGKVTPLGTTTSPLEDDSTTNPIIVNGSNVTAVAGNLVYYNRKEFIFDGTKWIELGDLSSLGSLAYKNNASGTYTPSGTIGTQTFTGSSMTATGTFTPAGSITVNKSNVDYVVSPKAATGQSNSYTPSGTVTPDIVLSTTTVNSITAVGTLPTCTFPKMSTTVVSENLTFTWTDGTFTSGTLPTKGANTTVATGLSKAEASFAGTAVRLVAASVPTVSSATFSGTAGNVSVTGTPSGNISQGEFTGKSATITVS